MNCGLVAADALVLPGNERIEDERYALESNDSWILPQLYFSSRDALGRPVGQKLVWVLRRTAQTQNLDSDERSAVTMETRIRRIASQVGMPSQIALRAIYLYRKARTMNIVRKPGLEDWARAMLLTACRDTRYVITMEDLVGSPKNKRSIKTVLRYFKDIKRVLGLKLNSFTVSNYISYFAGKIHDLPFLTTAANDIVAIQPRSITDNSDPTMLAAAALYIAIQRAGFDISQKEFCSHGHLSEISLRKWVARLGGSTHGLRFVDEILDRGIDTEQVLDSGPEEDYKRPDSEHHPQDDGKLKAAPAEPERKDDRADDGENDADRVEGRKEARNRRKVAPKPRRVPRRRRPARDAHKRKSNRGDFPVNDSHRPRRFKAKLR